MIAQGTDWIDLLLGQGGLLVALLVVIVTGTKRIWVFGWLYQEKKKEMEQWRELALRGTTLAEKAVKVVDSGGSSGLIG